MATRAKAGLHVNEAFLPRGVRSVSLGNGLYPPAALVATKVVPRVLLVSDAPLSAALAAEFAALQRRLGPGGAHAFTFRRLAPAP